ncbi:arylsulfotransferase family protein [Mycolicibacterium aichiense]|uniref:arylsulfotransferase family protein n=1 Tax=Mycolicibacterium aichiense TaxID=1799 RepID=UPI003D67ABD0
MNDPGGASGYVFYTRGVNLGEVAAGGQPIYGTSYLQIADKSGRPVWIYQLPEGEQANDFAVQQYRGQTVLTWLQCKGLASCKGYIADDNYNIIATVPTSLNGTELDAHEFRLTPEGNALVIGDKDVDADLTSVGGPQNGKVLDTVAMVVDPATGQVLGQWDPMHNVPITDSLLPYMGGSYDAYHANSVDIGRDGNLLVSLRSTSAVYNVNPYTGEIIYQLGGKTPTITAGQGVQFSGQHDAQYVGNDTIQLFNDNNFGPAGTKSSSIQVIHVDPVAGTATLITNLEHPDDLHAWATGNAQLLSNGNYFGSWGTTGRISEFTADGQLVYEATTPDTSYRVFLSQWGGSPQQKPEVTVPTAGQSTVHAVWNGATAVRQWRVLYGTSSTNLAPIATVDWNGLDTTIQLPTDATAGYFQVEALDANGTVLGTSAVVER